MMLPPLVARVRVVTPRRAYGAWLPLFLLWILLLPLVLLLVVALAATAVVAPRWRFGAVAAGLYAAVCEARGTRVDVEGGDGRRVFVALH
jgi:hypothetical protein